MDFSKLREKGYTRNQIAEAWERLHEESEGGSGFVKNNHYENIKSQISNEFSNPSSMQEEITQNSVDEDPMWRQGLDEALSDENQRKLDRIAHQEKSRIPDGMTGAAIVDKTHVSPSPAVVSDGIDPTTHASTVSDTTGDVGRSSQSNRMKLWYEDEVEFTSQWKHSLDVAQRRAEKSDEFEVSFGEQFARGMALNNPVMSAIVQAPMGDFPIIDDYSPFDDAQDGKTDIDGYEEHWKAFVDSTSPEMTAVLKQRIDEENYHREILSQGGAQGVIASIASGLTDPINLALIALPLTTEAGVAKIVGAGLLATTASEGILHATQETRTMEETALNLAATAIFDGALGSLAVTVSKGQKEIITRQIEEAISTSTSVGAAERRIATGESASGEVIKRGLGANLAAKLALITPLGRTLQSSEKSVRALVQDMVESGIHLQGNFVPTAVESLIKLDYAKWAEVQTGVRGLEKRFMKETGLDKRAFSEQLDAAMRRGDLSENATVQEAAQKLRAVIEEKWTRAAELQIDGTYTKVKGEDGAEDTIQPIRSETAPSWMTRRYDMNAVRSDPENFKKAWIAGMKDQHAREGGVPAGFGSKGLPVESRYKEVADNIYESVFGLKVGDAHYDVGASGGKVFKQRLDIRDEFVEPYLIKDWESNMEGYMKSMTPRIRLAEKFGNEEGDFMMSAALKQVNDKFIRRVKALDKKISDPSTVDKKALHKEKDALLKEQKSQIRDIEVMRDRLLNTTQEPSMMNPENRGILSALRAARSWNIATSLSNVVISSVPDLARLITHGRFSALARAFQKSAFSKDLLRSNLPKSEIAKMASAFERAASYRMQQLAEVEDGVVHTAFDKYAHKVADSVITFSGMKHWNAVLKTVSGHLIGDQIALSVLKGKTAALKRLGFTDVRIRDLKKAIDEHAVDENGLWNLNLERWTDRDLVEKVEAAAIKEADRLIVTPSVGDKPLFATTEYGKTLLQFKSFVVAATNKVMLPLLQESGIRPWMEVATSVALGLGIANFKALMRGDEIKPEDQMQEAIAATGLTGYAMELYRLGFEKDSLRRGADGVMGPTIGLANNAMTLMSGAKGDASSEQTAKALRRLTPFQNNYVLKKGFDAVEEATAKALGGSSNASF